VQFVRHGTDIPERLLQLHEDGRVVFFCGAGISDPRGCPAFPVGGWRAHQALSVTPDPCSSPPSRLASSTRPSVCWNQMSSVVGKPCAVRWQRPAPDLTAPNATSTHEALLTLAQNREGRTRLITTNF
jgi:NAD-dependent SIR2 family protein deacetylase